MIRVSTKDHKMIQIKNPIIYSKLNFINGNVFYCIEYFFYLKKYFDIKLIIDLSIDKEINICLNKNVLFKAWEDKYSQETLNKLHKYIYNNDIIFIKNQNIFSPLTIALDSTSIKYCDKSNKTYKIFSKKYLINYGDDETSLKNEFNKKNFITFGDKDIGCKVNFHHSLKLNFELFKKLKHTEIDNSTFIEIKNSNIFDRKRNIKNFHKLFNKLIFFKKNFWERANRLIPECKFYKKEIFYKTYDNWIDSADLRFKRSLEYYDINEDINFVDFIKGNLNEINKIH